MIAGNDHVTRNTKEMLNCIVGKSNLAVFEQILLRNCFEHGQLLKDRTKVSVSKIESIPQHPLCPYGSGALIRIDFHPETAEKIAPHCMARLDLANCIANQNIVQLSISIQNQKWFSFQNDWNWVQ